jgi:hypothetical protein
MGIHIQVQRSGFRELHLIAASHFLKYRRFSVHNLVMGKRQDIVFIVKILHGKGQAVIRVRPLFRICTEIIERIVHPSHIPLVIKAKSPLRYGLS